MYKVWKCNECGYKSDTVIAVGILESTFDTDENQISDDNWCFECYKCENCGSKNIDITEVDEEDD